MNTKKKSKSQGAVSTVTIVAMICVHVLYKYVCFCLVWMLDSKNMIFKSYGYTPFIVPLERCMSTTTTTFVSVKKHNFVSSFQKNFRSTDQVRMLYCCIVAGRHPKQSVFTTKREILDFHEECPKQYKHHRLLRPYPNQSYLPRQPL